MKLAVFASWLIDLRHSSRQRGVRWNTQVEHFLWIFAVSCVLWHKRTPLNHPSPSSEITSVSLKCLVITLLPTSAFGDWIHSCIFYNLRDVKCFSFFSSPAFSTNNALVRFCLKHFKMLVRSLEEMQLSGSVFCINTIIQLGLRRYHSSSLFIYLFFLIYNSRKPQGNVERRCWRSLVLSFSAIKGNSLVFTGHSHSHGALQSIHTPNFKERILFDRPTQNSQ